MKMKALHITHNETPKMAKNVRLYSQVVTFFTEHNFRRVFLEHVSVKIRDLV